jgi:hypothetical protein
VPVTVECLPRQHTEFAVFIPAGVRHRISGALIVSIYLDVLAEEGQVLPKTMTPIPINIAPADAALIADSLKAGAGDTRSAGMRPGNTSCVIKPAATYAEAAARFHSPAASVDA